jgi:hypothetical protein
MTRMTSQDSDIRDHARALSSPVALAFVRIAMACRGVSEAAAQQIYLDYIDGVRPGRESSHGSAC